MQKDLQKQRIEKEKTENETNRKKQKNCWEEERTTKT